MVSNPGQLPADASAQAAGELLQRPEVRAVYVTQDERLVGVVTRKTLVREVVAAGREPGVTPLGAIAEVPHYSIGPDVPLEEAFRFLEEEDAERAHDDRRPDAIRRRIVSCADAAPVVATNAATASEPIRMRSCMASSRAACRGLCVMRQASGGGRGEVNDIKRGCLSALRFQRFSQSESGQ